MNKIVIASCLSVLRLRPPKHIILNQSKRGPHRPRHIEIAENLAKDGYLIAAGPVLPPNSTIPSGAVFLFQSQNDSVAKDFVAIDPYVINGLVTSHTIREWSIVVGKL